MNTKPENWRNEKQIRGYQSQLQAALNGSTDGAYVTMDCTTAAALIDICKQARNIEQNRGN